MKITLDQTEIEQALKNYVAEQMHIKEGMNISIDIRATRGEGGMTAVIDIAPAGTTSPTPVVDIAAPEPVKQFDVSKSLFANLNKETSEGR